MTKLRLLTALLGLVLPSCGGKAGEAVRPKDLSGANALGKPVPSCQGEPKLASPLVVDLDSSSRVDLEAALKKKGVVVVSYDCKTLRVLPACKAGIGDYEYAGVSRKEDVVQMKNQDELSVNLPLSAGKVGGEIKSGNSIDLALVYVGQRSTAVGKVDRAEMSGSCEEATHFMRAANVGAFSMATGSVGKVTAVADLFKVGASGSSSSSRSAATMDGSLESCRTSNPDATSPPPECRAPISVQLLPLAGTATPTAKPEKKGPSAPDKPDPKASIVTREKEARPLENPCPAGFVLANGICTNETETSHRCKPADDAECKAQCEKGSAESCYNYAAGKSVPPKERGAYYKKACDGGSAEGCGYHALLRWDSDNPKSPANRDAIELAKKGCAMGGPKACSILGDFYGHYADHGPFADPAQSFKAFDRGCALGDGASCLSAADFHLNGDGGVPKSEARAIELMERACYGDYDAACDPLMVHLLLKAEPANRDPDHAFRVAEYGCKAWESNCANGLRVALIVGKQPEAFAMAKSGCERNQVTCEEVGDLYSTGRGTAKDPAKATEYWKKACDDYRTIDKTGPSTACDKAAGKPGKKVGDKLAENAADKPEPAAKPAAKPSAKPKKKK